MKDLRDIKITIMGVLVLAIQLILDTNILTKDDKIIFLSRNK